MIKILYIVLRCILLFLGFIQFVLLEFDLSEYQVMTDPFMGYPGSDIASPNVQGSNSPLPQGGGPSPQGGSPSPQGGDSLPNSSEHVHETTVLANFLSNFLNQRIRNTGIKLAHPSPEHDPNISRILLYVRNDHPEFFTSKGITEFAKMTIREKFVEDIRGLEKDYPNLWPSRMSPKELLAIRDSRLNN